MNVFDIIGPVMVGPSSSHTAGAVRIGRIVREILGGQPSKANIVFHGSFARTYRGHGTDKAIIAGLLGLNPDDVKVRESMALAQQARLQYTITTGVIKRAHPNTALITAADSVDRQITVLGSSVGGGNIVINKINGMEVEFTAQYNTLIIFHHDTPGAIAAITNILANNGINIANMKVYRSCRGGNAIMIIETDQEVGRELEALIRQLQGINNTALIRPV